VLICAGEYVGEDQPSSPYRHPHFDMFHVWLEMAVEETIPIGVVHLRTFDLDYPLIYSQGYVMLKLS
jgi:hypothetical protein